MLLTETFIAAPQKIYKQNFIVYRKWCVKQNPPSIFCELPELKSNPSGTAQPFIYTGQTVAIGTASTR